MAGNGKFTACCNGTTSASVTNLPTPGAGKTVVIDSITVHALGTVTVFKVEVLDSGSNDLAVIGGQIGGATNGSLPLSQSIVGPFVCLVNDKPSVLVTSTGASSTTCNVCGHIENA
jgi:hypothetical protein